MSFTSGKYVLREFITPGGISPYREWLESLSSNFRARIQARLLRFEQGNLGDVKSVGKSVWEARLDFGPGFRVYFAFENRELILLLVGGDKGTQSKDIKKAQMYWAEYTETK